MSDRGCTCKSEFVNFGACVYPCMRVSLMVGLCACFSAECVRMSERENVCVCVWCVCVCVCVWGVCVCVRAHVRESSPKKPPVKEKSD